MPTDDLTITFRFPHAGAKRYFLAGLLDGFGENAADYHWEGDLDETAEIEIRAVYTWKGERIGENGEVENEEEGDA